MASSSNLAPPGQATAGGENAFAPPPQRKSFETDASSPIHYTRDPHRLVAYLVPFPKPNIEESALHKAGITEIPDRFLIYTPPPPPLRPPKEGEKEGRAHKVQRKWQEEVRNAKTSDAKITSWKGAKGRATKGIDKGMNWMTSSGLDFLNRVPGKPSGKAEQDAHSADDPHEQDTTHKTVGLEEMVLIYPPSIPGDEETIRKEFVESMLRNKSKAQRDAVISTGLLPVSFAIDVLATVIWPFGGLAEIDGVWALASLRGAKTARSVTKRLNSSGPSEQDDHQLKLSFTASPRMIVLARYLATECHKVDRKLFNSAGLPPTGTEALESIGWSPSSEGLEERNWEDEQWQTSEVKEDLQHTMHKGAKEWDKWCKELQKDPQKALGKPKDEKK